MACTTRTLGFSRSLGLVFGGVVFVRLLSTMP